MKKITLLLAIVMCLAAIPAIAGNVGFGINVNLGIPAQPIVVEQPPAFIAPPELGFSVAVGIPYDMVFIGNQYYAYRGNQWYCGPRYNGPWRSVSYRYLPSQIRRYPIEKIRYARDREYRGHDYRRNYYEGRHQGPGSYVEARHRDYKGSEDYRGDHSWDNERRGRGSRD